MPEQKGPALQQGARLYPDGVKPPAEIPAAIAQRCTNKGKRLDPFLQSGSTAGRGRTLCCTPPPLLSPAPSHRSRGPQQGDCNCCREGTTDALWVYSADELCQQLTPFISQGRGKDERRVLVGWVFCFDVQTMLESSEALGLPASSS